MNFLNGSRENSAQNIEHVYSILNELDASLLTSNIILLLIFFFGLIFNIISIVLIIIARAFTPINLLIINLALADITYSLGIPFFISQSLNLNWNLGELGCRIFIFTEFSGIIVGIFTIAALSVERFLDVADKKNCFEITGNRLKPCFIVIYSILVWMFALCFTLPIIFSIQLKKNDEFYNCESDWEDSTLKLFFIIKLFLIFIIPYTVIIISSFKLLKFLNDWKKRFDNSAFSSRRVNEIRNLNTRSRLNSQSIQTSVVLIGCKYASIIRKNSCSFDKENNYDQVSDPMCQNEASNQETLSNDLKSPKLNTNELNYQAYINLNLTEFLYEPEIVSQNNFKFSKLFSNVKKNLTRRRAQNKSIIKNKYLNSIRRKAVRLVLVIVLLFVIQWSPFWIFQILILFSTSNIRHIRSINMVVSTLTYSNTVANPALYMLLTYNFKEYLQKALRSLPFFKRCYSKF
ncbi:unnamed protein product [Brachionus calyciflorus]|uniref:G-protein coupled receptors family 1 profile domain-containing protein n=1 Tax=Brachionus calyciflorus TaxID=104777 RepID=A0A814BC27_9BILA|nr:unnamed protein product [Brachionus calyciflorus]